MALGEAGEKTGEALQLFVVKAPLADLTEAQLIEFCRKKLIGYNVAKRCASSMRRRSRRWAKSYGVNFAAPAGLRRADRRLRYWRPA
jgi:acyl-CoA synthetase (AMP-forming)/AMP-acid ligase II